MNISYQGRSTTDILAPYSHDRTIPTPSRIRFVIEWLRDAGHPHIALQLRQGLLTIEESERLAYDAELTAVPQMLRSMMEVVG